MTASNVAPPTQAVAKPSINFFERYLTVWVALCIVAGIVLGQVLPDVFQQIGRMEYAQGRRTLGSNLSECPPCLFRPRTRL